MVSQWLQFYFYHHIFKISTLIFCSLLLLCVCVIFNTIFFRQLWMRIASLFMNEWINKWVWRKNPKKNVLPQTRPNYGFGWCGFFFGLRYIGCVHAVHACMHGDNEHNQVLMNEPLYEISIATFALRWIEQIIKWLQYVCEWFGLVGFNLVRCTCYSCSLCLSYALTSVQFFYLCVSLSTC